MDHLCRQYYDGRVSNSRLRYCFNIIFTKMAFYSKSSAVRQLFTDSDDEEEMVSLPPLKNGSESEGADMEMEGEGEDDEDGFTLHSVRRRIIDDFDDDDDESSTSDRSFGLTASQERRLRLFHKELFDDWNRPNSGCIDIPVLIMDLEALSGNQDLDAIPRFYANQIRADTEEDIPFAWSDECGSFVSLNAAFREFGFSEKSPPSAAKFRTLIEKKPQFDNDAMMPFYEGVNIFLYSTFLFKQFASTLGFIDHFYSPISDEAKYYFYLFFDYLRRKAIATDSLFLKRDVIRLARELGSLEGYGLTRDLILRNIHGIAPDLFDVEGFRILDSSEPFTISV
jgi:hypothetical protein